jgi:predicted nucleotidyltransferase
MFNKNESRILERLAANFRCEYSLSDISKELKQDYAQTHRSIQPLIGSGLVICRSVGKSRMIKLDFLKYHPEYTVIEAERLKNILKNKIIALVYDKIIGINKQFICILFGSYASGKFNERSDIDLLFIIPDEYDLSKFEKSTKNMLSMYNADINVIKEDSLFEMWAHPEKLNVGNELLVNHIVLYGADQFLNLVRKHHVGR